MSYLLVQPNVILKTIELDANRLKKSSISRVKRCSYHMVIRWLTTYETDSTSSDTERLQGYFQAFLTLCDIHDFERAKALLLLSMDNQKPLYEYFGKLGLYIEQCQLYEALLDQFDSRFNCFLLNGLGWAYGYLGKTDRALLSHQQELEIAQALDNDDLKINAYEGLGGIYSLNLAKPKEGEYCYDKMLEISIKTGNIKKQIFALIGQGIAIINLVRHNNNNG